METVSLIFNYDNLNAFIAIRDPGTHSIVELLRSPQCTLTELNLGCNEIWDEGGKALGEVLKINKTVS
jgi:hypothetical protein